MSASPHAISADLTAVVVAVTAGDPRSLTIRDGRALPSGPFELGHRSLQAGLRTWVEHQTHYPLGYVEQLYTFADRDRVDQDGRRIVSISYLGLTREETAVRDRATGWQEWYAYFPWEDRRARPPWVIMDAILPLLRRWAESADEPDRCAERLQRAAFLFGFDGHGWNEEMVLQRYEILYEAGVVPEALQGCAAGYGMVPGQPMDADHRRILATGIARLRAKIKYRPVVFELMPPTFTLLQLQRSVEGIAGRPVHKQNFRRLVEQQDLVEETGALTADTGGRPAKLFRFRREVVAERALSGAKLPLRGIALGNEG